MIDIQNIFKNKTVLVTGDTGFKGSWLAIWLHMLGAEVIGYSLPPVNPMDNYILCGLEKKYEHIDGDIRNSKKLLTVFKKYKPQFVFHLAAQPLVLRSYEEPSYTFETNFMGTVNILEAIRQTSRVSSAVIITSDKCYKNEEWVYGYRENDRLGGKDPYSGSKAACEIAVSSYVNSFFGKSGQIVSTVRAGNVFGGGDWSENRIFPDCIKAIESNAKIIIRNPDSVRPWQHVLDPLSGYIKVAAMGYDKQLTNSEAWNFGPAHADIKTVLGLVKMVIKKYGRGSYAVEGQKRDLAIEANLLYLDTIKSFEKLKWFPVLNIKTAVEFAVDEYKIGNMNKSEVYSQRINHIKKYTAIKNKMESEIFYEM